MGAGATGSGRGGRGAGRIPAPGRASLLALLAIGLAFGGTAVAAGIDGSGVAGGSDAGSPAVDDGPFQTGPTADLAVTPNPAAPGETVELDARASTAPPGETVVACEFDVDGDGAIDRTATNCLATVTYDSTGERSVTVRVVTDENRTATDTVALAVAANVPPRPVVTVEPAQPAPGEAVRFSASNSTDVDGEVVEFIWQVDGEGLTGETITSAFETAGEYEVALLVRDDDGAENRTSTTVSVGTDGGPRAALAATPTRPAVGTSVTLDAGGSTHATGAIVSYRWDLDGDGEPDRTTAEPETTVTFDDEGPALVGVTAVDEEGRTDTATTELVVGPAGGNATNATATTAAGPTADGGGDDAGDGQPLDLGLVPFVPDLLALLAVLLLALLGGLGVAVQRREAVTSRVHRLRELLTRGDVRRRLAKKVSGTAVKNLAKRTIRRFSDLVESGGEFVGDGLEGAGRAIKRGSRRVAEWLRRLGG